MIKGSVYIMYEGYASNKLVVSSSLFQGNDEAVFLSIRDYFSPQWTNIHNFNHRGVKELMSSFGINLDTSDKYKDYATMFLLLKDMGIIESKGMYLYRRGLGEITTYESVLRGVDEENDFVEGVLEA